MTNLFNKRYHDRLAQEMGFKDNADYQRHYYEATKKKQKENKTKRELIEYEETKKIVITVCELMKTMQNISKNPEIFKKTDLVKRFFGCERYL